MMTSELDERPLVAHQPQPSTFVIVASVLAAASIAAFLAVDVFNVGGSRVWILERRGDTAGLWIHLFGEGGPVDMAQWLLLAYLTVVAGIIGGYLSPSTGRPSAASFWKFVAIGTTLMIMEDAGNVRQQLIEYGIIIFRVPEDSLAVGLIVVIWFGIIAGFFGWALFRHGRAVFSHRGLRRYGIVGIAMYVLYAASDISEALIHWYVGAGAFLEENILRTSLHQPDIWTTDQLHFFLIDKFVEEAFELIAAAFLAAAAAAYIHTLHGRPRRPGEQGAAGVEDTEALVVT